jgi:linoleoyl-CoA desaturase
MQSVDPVVDPSFETSSATVDTPKTAPRFTQLQHDPFAVELTQKVRAYFSQNGLSPHGDLRMWAKSAFLLLGYLGVFVAILFQSSAGIGVLGLWALMGLFKVGIGFNVGHDALHGAYSSRGWVNDLMGHSYSLLGAHGGTWKILHNRIHHAYTNVIGADGDLHGISWLRFFKSDEGLRPYHRFQWLYAPLLYSLTTLVWVFRKDFQHIRKTRHMLCDKPPLPPFAIQKLWILKLSYIVILLGLPVVVGAQSIGMTLLGFLVMHAVAGLLLALVFQLGHIVESTKVYDLSSPSFPSWHRLQTEGSSNFCTRNPLVSWFCGGLNFQIEHHLFPQVCHVHYPEISQIVQQCAQKHGVSYSNYPTLSSALHSHFRVLQQNGRA